MTWNHRVVRTPEGALQISEVMYNDDGSLMGYAEADVYWHPDHEGDGPESLRTQVEWFAEALNKPVIDHSEFRG